MCVWLPVKSLPRSNPNECIQLPGDKSVTHRALFLRAIWALQNPSEGQTLEQNLFAGLENASIGQDCRTSHECLLQVLSVPLESFKKNSTNHNHLYFCKNSGTTVRLLPSVLRQKSKLSGDTSLSKRPMSRVFDFFEPTAVTYLDKAGCLPIEFSPGKKVGDLCWETSIASAQLKTLWFFLAIQSKGDHSLRIKTGSRIHTETMVQRLGVTFSQERQDDVDIFAMRGPIAIDLCKGKVPSDPSALAFWILAAAICGAYDPIEIAGLSGDRHRLAYLQALKKAGFRIVLSESAQQEHYVDHSVDCRLDFPNEWTGFHMDAAACAGSIDELPVLVLLAAAAEGKSSFASVAELRVKESDRLRWVERLLVMLSVDFEVSDKAGNTRIDVEGLGRSRFLEQLSGLSGETIQSLGDHRLAMIACVLSASADSAIQVDETECIDVSYPGFLKQLKKWRVSL